MMDRRKKKSEKGAFFSFEGPDHSGKSTQIAMLRDHLENLGHIVSFYREPGSSRIGEKIRQLLLDPSNTEMEPTTELLLYSSSRAQLVGQHIKPDLDNGYIVLCDRFYDSSIAYQGFGRWGGLPEIIEQMLMVTMFATSGLKPDLTFYIQGSATRVQEKVDKDRIESENEAFHKRMMKGYDWVAKQEPERVKIIPFVENNIDAMYYNILGYVEAYLAKIKPQNE